MKKNQERINAKISLKSKSLLKILATRANKSEFDYASKTFEFIYKTGLNVYSNSIISPVDLIKNLENRMIGFLKKRETDFFIPMSKKVDSLTEVNLDLINRLQSSSILADSTDLEMPKNDFYILPEIPKNIPSESAHIPIDNSTQENSFLSNDQLEGKLQKAEKKAELFQKELTFLFKRISKSGALSGSKFNININQRDIDRIKFLLDDN